MPFTALAKNTMLAAIASGTAAARFMDRVGAFDADPSKSFTGVTSTDVLTSTAHGFSNGNIVAVSALTGGANLVVGRPYFIVAVATNTFQLALTPGGTAIDIGTDVSAGTVIRYVELTGGSPAYARKAIAWNTPADGTIDDSTNGAVIDVPAGATVDAVGGWHNASGDLVLFNIVTPSTDAAQWTYTVTDADLTIGD
jgi:hypothetical protein